MRISTYKRKNRSGYYIYMYKPRSIVNAIWFYHATAKTEQEARAAFLRYIGAE